MAKRIFKKMVSIKGFYSRDTRLAQYSKIHQFIISYVNKYSIKITHISVVTETVLDKNQQP